MGRMRTMRRSRDFRDRRMSSEESDENEEDSMQLKLSFSLISVLLSLRGRRRLLAYNIAARYF